MALENILTSIKEEASTEAEGILATAEKNASDILKQSKKEVARIESDVDSRVSAEVNEIVQKARLEMSSKKQHQLLHVQRAAIENVFTSALEKLSSLDDAQYVNLMKSLLGRLPKGDFVLHSASEKEALLSKAVSENGASYQMGDGIDSKGGFIATSETLEVNLTFESLLEENRDSLELEVSEKLFS